MDIPDLKRGIPNESGKTTFKKAIPNQNKIFLNYFVNRFVEVTGVQKADAPLYLDKLIDL